MASLILLGLTLAADAAILLRTTRSPSVAATTAPSPAPSPQARPEVQILPPTSGQGPTLPRTTASVALPNAEPNALPNAEPNALPDTATARSASASRPLRIGRATGPSDEGDALRPR